MLALYARRNAESKWSQDQLKRLHEIQQEQKQLLADTLAGSVLPLIEQVLRQRTRQWVDVIHTQLTRRM